MMTARTSSPEAHSGCTSTTESSDSESGSGDDDGALLLCAPTKAVAVKNSCTKKVTVCTDEHPEGKTRTKEHTKKSSLCCAKEDTDEEAIDRDPRSDGLSCIMESEETQHGSMGWNPGWSVGEWVGRASPLSPQSQVLVANVYFCLKRLPKAVLKAVTSTLTHVARSSTELGSSNV
jgi:hypothetical protein